MEIIEQLKKIVAEKHLKIQLTDAVMNQDFKTLGLDSLDTFSIIVDLEKHFGVSLSDEQMMALRTVNDLVKAFENLISQKSA